MAEGWRTRDAHGFVLTGSVHDPRGGLSAPLESLTGGRRGRRAFGSVKRVGGAIGEGAAVVAWIHQYRSAAG
jgi:thioredoxin reductase (NADPH)